MKNKKKLDHSSWLDRNFDVLLAGVLVGIILAGVVIALWGDA